MSDIVPYNKQAIQKYQQGAAAHIYHITTGQVALIAALEEKNRRNGERNALLIKFIFDGCFRISEALSVRPYDINASPEGYTVNVLGKGSKPGTLAISHSIAAEIQSYCRKHDITSKDRIFKVSRSQAWRIITGAFDRAGVARPTVEHDHVGGVHVLRHSGAIERLRLTGNPKAVQDQLRHVSAEMTLRYMKTLSAEESLKLNQGVEIW